jgi:hypothetical protein
MIYGQSRVGIAGRLVGQSVKGIEHVVSSGVRSHGDVSGSNALITALDAPARNLQNTKDKHTDKPAKKRTTPYRTHMLYLLSRRGWKQPVVKIFRAML